MCLADTGLHRDNTIAFESSATWKLSKVDDVLLGDQILKRTGSVLKARRTPEALFSTQPSYLFVFPMLHPWASELVGDLLVRDRVDDCVNLARRHAGIDGDHVRAEVRARDGIRIS